MNPRGAPQPVVVVVETAFALSPAATIAAAAGLHAPDIIRPRGILPGVARVEGHTAAWSAPGQTRRLTLTDASVINERLTAFEPEAFDYRVSGFGGPLGVLVRDVDARFAVRRRDGGSWLSWRYAFNPASRFAAPMVGVLARALWPGYMRAAIVRLRDATDAGGHG